MRLAGKLVLAGVIGSIGAGCGSDSTGANGLPNIVGTWHASSAVVTSVANPATSSNLIALGASLQVVFNANLTYTSTVTIPGQAADVSNGTYVETATTLSLHDAVNPADVVTFSLAVNGAALVLTGGSPFTFDFGAGDVPARFDLTLVH